MSQGYKLNKKLKKLYALSLKEPVGWIAFFNRVSKRMKDYPLSFCTPNGQEWCVLQQQEEQPMKHDGHYRTLRPVPPNFPQINLTIEG